MRTQFFFSQNCFYFINLCCYCYYSFCVVLSVCVWGMFTHAIILNIMRLMKWEICCKSPCYFIFFFSIGQFIKISVSFLCAIISQKQNFIQNKECLVMPVSREANAARVYFNAYVPHNFLNYISRYTSVT